MVAILIGIYILAMLISIFVDKKRAGLPVMRGLKVFGRGGVGLGWLMINVGKSFAWPVILVVWIATGRPDPRTQFLDLDTDPAVA